jgi:sporulation protein YtfJ
MKTAMESLKAMVDVNTVVGDPVEAQSGEVIIPISRVAFGFATGGGEYAAGPTEMGRAPGEFPFAGGSGAGVSVQPVGFLVVGQGNVRMLPVEGGQPVDRLIDLAPQIIEKLRSAKKGGGNGAAAQGTDQGVPRTTPCQ